MLTETSANLSRFKASVREEIDALRQLGAKRQALSLHACKRLFFDLGQRPSSVLVRELTGVGSASDIPKDIDLFWTQLRETASTRAAAGRIPPELEETAGQLLGQLFDKAIELASNRLQAEHGQTGARLELLEQRERETQIREELVRQDIERARGEQQQALNQERRANEQWLIEQQRSQQLTADVAAANRHIELLREQLAAKDLAIDDLNRRLIATIERSAADVKSANADAERRIRPLLVELDALRGANQRPQQPGGNRQEFEMIQQLSGMKRKVDELQTANRDLETELAEYRAQLVQTRPDSSAASVLQALILHLAAEQRLTPQEISEVAPALDAVVAAPETCPGCGEPPEIFAIDGKYELSCSNCGRESGLQPSRLAAFAGFQQDAT
jgi:hypothetical protein